ncbi:hypothetical protein ACFCW2_08550 [Qipengyuania sp. DSG2-2]|uniref:hypothetical protein n=1 Tax=Qipengyuania sp. DGS2-2 TaxID=3349631 RepID=UPI0036D3C873
MSSPQELPAWIALFLGLYSLAAAVGELRVPGSWMAMVEDLEASPGTRFLTGIVCVILGATLYLVGGWDAAIKRGDWLAAGIALLGGIAAAEGLFILAAGDRFLALSRKMMARHTSLWAGLSALAGGALVFLALSRLQFV